MIRQHVVAKSLEIAKAVEKIKEVNYELADMGLEQVPVPTIEGKPGLTALGASDIRTVNDSLARFDASVEHFKQTALDAEKKLKKARAGQSAAKADALLNEWLSDAPSSLIQVAEGAGELLQELLNGLKSASMRAPPSCCAWTVLPCSWALIVAKMPLRTDCPPEI